MHTCYTRLVERVLSEAEEDVASEQARLLGAPQL